MTPMSRCNRYSKTDRPTDRADSLDTRQAKERENKSTRSTAERWKAKSTKGKNEKLDASQLSIR